MRRCTPATLTRDASTKRPSPGYGPNTPASEPARRHVRGQARRKVDAVFFDRMSAEWRAEQDRCQREIERHQDADQSYMEEGVRILELARNAQRLFEKQEPREKRRLLNFVVSNCTWKDGEVVADFRQPFDLLAETTAIAAQAAPRARAI